ncbi:transposase [Desulfosediminicola flagellatus]|uniref:transposase n=1 Tax=Desulfosediminicola flagellatus TaxID=2569541 RepID=UPI00142F009B|nr:transposase [Desulfosediminicola flagellatus]
MSRRSDIHFQQGVSLFDFQLQFGSENQCSDHLFKLKCPKGYSCPKYGYRQYYFIRFSRIEGFSSLEILRWGQLHLKPSTIVVSDGLARVTILQDIHYFHYSMLTSDRYNSPDFTVFDWLNTIIGNVKNTIKGTYNGIDHMHLLRYLGGFCFRFNRRFKLKRLLESRIYYSSNICQIPEHQLRLAEDWL